jgi:hypothetical protein
MRASLAVAVLAAALAAAVAGCRAGPQPGQASPLADTARVLASRAAACPSRSQPDPGATAFREAGAWSDHLGSLPPPVRAPLEDWWPDFRAGESVVLARAGELPNPGYRVTMPEQTLPIRAGVLQIQLAALPPPQGSMQAQVMTPACLYLRLDRADFSHVAVEVIR